MLSTDRQRGTLLRLSITDALSAAVEFEMPGTFREVTGYHYCPVVVFREVVP
jgi:hypothetical protein